MTSFLTPHGELPETDTHVELHVKVAANQNAPLLCHLRRGYKVEHSPIDPLNERIGVPGDRDKREGCLPNKSGNLSPDSGTQSDEVQTIQIELIPV